MKTLIGYCSSHGTTQTAANLLAEKLSSDTTVVNLKKERLPSLNEFDAIIIGGSIHLGKIQKQVSKFCEQQRSELLTKKTGFFICCLEEGEKARLQLENVYPQQLLKHAGAIGIFGCGFHFEKMNFFERLIVRKVVKISESVSKIDHEAIALFADKINTSLKT